MMGCVGWVDWTGTDDVNILKIQDEQQNINIIIKIINIAKPVPPEFEIDDIIGSVLVFVSVFVSVLVIWSISLSICDFSKSKSLGSISFVLMFKLSFKLSFVDELEFDVDFTLSVKASKFSFDFANIR